MGSELGFEYISGYNSKKKILNRKYKSKEKEKGREKDFVNYFKLEVITYAR